MIRAMVRPAAVLLAAVLLAGPAAAGQVAPPPQPVPPAAPARPAVQVSPNVLSDEDARQTRDVLGNLLRRYPPSLVQVLTLDPSLLSDAAYLAPYPVLATFLAQHPEVAHNPAFFMGQIEGDTSSSRARAVSEVFASLFALTGFMSFFGLVAWIAKMIADHRRWLRTSKVQTEAHAKLFDRLTSNEDLMAYTQTPAGRRFLEAAPMALDAGPRAIGAPLGRILWSMQAGTVLSLLGAGLLFLRARTAADALMSDSSPFFFVFGVVILAIGAGFFVSALLAYLVSRHLKLFEIPTSSNA